MKKKTKASTQTAIRLDDELLDRIDKLAELISKRSGIPTTRSEALRRAVNLGVEKMEATQR